MYFRIAGNFMQKVLGNTDDFMFDFKMTGNMQDFLFLCAIIFFQTQIQILTHAGRRICGNTDMCYFKICFAI